MQYQQIPSTSQEASELVKEASSSKRTTLTALCMLIVLVLATFGLIVLATEYSKEMSVVAGSLYDKSTGQVVSTRCHMSPVDPFSVNQANLKWITVSSGNSASKYQVVGSTQSPCDEVSDSCIDGFRSTYQTQHGYFLASLDSVGSYTFTQVVNMEHPAVAASTKAVVTGTN